MASNGIPVVTYGRHVNISQQVVDGLAPEYDVVHAWVDLETVKRELPLLFEGDKSIVPREGVGSNAGRPESERRIPRAALCGGGIPENEFEELKKHVSSQLGRDITWFKVRLEDVKSHAPPGREPSEGPVAEFAVKVFREKLAGFE